MKTVSGSSLRILATMRRKNPLFLTCPRWRSLTRAALRPRQVPGRFANRTVARVILVQLAFRSPNAPSAAASVNKISTIPWKLRPNPANRLAAKTTHDPATPNRRKLSSPIQTADTLYSPRTRAFEYRNASSDAVTKLMDSTPSVSAATKRAGTRAPSGEKIHVSYTKKCASKSTDWMTEMKPNNCCRDGIVF